MIKQEKIKGTISLKIEGFKVENVKLHTRSYKSQGLKIKPKTQKANKIVRAENARQSKPLQFMAMAEKDRMKKNRAEAQRNARRAKR